MSNYWRIDDIAFGATGVTRVAVIKPDESMFWQGLSHLLQADEQTEVLYCSSLQELAASDGGAAVDVAIVPWSRAADGYPWRTRLGWPECRVVVGIDDTTNEAVLWVQQTGRQTLLGLTQLFGGPEPTASQDAAASPDLAARLSEFAGMAPGDQRTRTLLLWAELIVRARLADLSGDPAAETPHVPGWTTGLGQVRTLMHARPEESGGSVRSALQRLEQRIAQEGLVSLGPGLPLDGLEQRILALALAPMLDGRFHAAYGYLHNDLTRTYASATLLADLLRSPGVDALTIWRAIFDGRIARFQLVEAEPGADGRAGPESPLRVPADLVDFFARGRISEAALGPALELTADPAAPLPDTEAAAELRAAIEAGHGPRLVQLTGPRPAADWASAILTAVGRRSLRVDVSRLGGDDQATLDRMAAKVARGARLTDAVPVLGGARQGGRLVQDLALLVARRRAVVIVDLEQPWTPPASVASRIIEPFAGPSHVTAAVWQVAAGTHRIEIDEADAIELAATRRDDPALAASVCRHLAASLGAGARVDLRTLRAAARSLSAPPDAGLVRRVQPVFGWRDIVLPDDRLARLREIPLHVRHAARVMDDWGYAARLPLGQGVAALFAGPSGTGKTMAAQVIAADLGVDVFQVDLAKTVSKYIGETEKHLNQAFADAERASAVLLFDEADALFGKRTEVKDAHDRYANIEVAYLLQRLEQFKGVVILTTNFRQNLDAAFVRRLRFVIDFPPPDAAQRLAIWQRALPQAAPRAPEFDLGFLARRFPLTGGHIQQIALTAAFLAAEAGRIEMAHVVAATRQQLAKLGMLSAEQSLAPRRPPPRGANGGRRL